MTPAVESSLPQVKPTMRKLIALLSVAAVLGLVWFSFHLAGNRIYQVDECTEVYVARILGTGQDKVQSPGHITLFQVLLSPVMGGQLSSSDLMATGRLVMFVIFWFNLLLIALLTRVPLMSWQGVLAVLGAATLTPVWDYGFEIRHDNLLLTGLLIMWALVRLRAPGIWAFFILGILTAALQFVAFKAFVYTVPISLIGIFLVQDARVRNRLKLLGAWVLGAAGSLLVLRVVLGNAGWWELFMVGSETLANTSAGGRRFPPWQTLGRLLTQTPLLLGVSVAGLICVGIEIFRRRNIRFDPDGYFPEALLLLLALAALLVNPAPFAYNLLFLVPFAYIFAFRFGVALVDALKPSHGIPWLPILVALVLFTHFGPFWTATRRHLAMTNYRQEKLMRIAENLTTPGKDFIYDGIFMVVSRQTDPRWFLHSFFVDRLWNGDGPKVREMLAEKPAVVFIPNYRTSWLPKEDHDYIKTRYVSLAEDFWVLGKVLPPGGGTFEIIHPGRYQISSKETSCLAGTMEKDSFGFPIIPEPKICPGTLNGKPIEHTVVELTVGTHHLQTDSNCAPAIVWLGPQLSRVPAAGEGSSSRLFVNWY